MTIQRMAPCRVCAAAPVLVHHGGSFEGPCGSTNNLATFRPSGLGSEHHSVLLCPLMLSQCCELVAVHAPQVCACLGLGDLTDSRVLLCHVPQRRSGDSVCVF